MINLVRLAAWLLALAIVAVTLVPLGLRPIVTPNPSIERSLVFAALGLLMVWGYPQRWPSVLLGCVVFAGGLEAAQTLTGTRHGRFDDFLVKGGAAVIGSLVGMLTVSWARRHAFAGSGR